MAARRKTSSKTPSETAGQTDPRAPLDGKALLAAAGPVLKLLAKDLKDRAEASPAVTAALESQHATERAARRTADPFPVWLGAFVDQVAAAWFLSCVFARTLEDRGLVAHARLAGPGAADSQRLFFDLAPSLAERDYLLTVFRELSRFPAARDLFDAKHNPVWLLTPSAEAAKALLGLFRTPSAEAPAFRFGQADTHFLADLYQDMNEEVQKRYALLQTPRFVESFILDRTLERAIERFGLDETTLIDPTCGGGHFLLGTFERLYDHRLRAEPGSGEREAARKALDAVYGADINPYAVAIARFRLTLAYLEKAGYSRLGDAPALPLHVVVADSLLHNPQLVQASFQDMEGQSAEAWAGKVYALEDERAAREVLHRRYAAVVGNPPYITVKDPVLRERYREMYSTAAGKYSLAAPFAQRFFQLARDGGAVGMITANSFMKREFGKKLIEDYLPTVNVDLIVNTADAEIPGHGTPTIMIFGTAESPQWPHVLAVLAKRGEIPAPLAPEEGLVWRSISDHWSEVGFENDHVSVAQMDRRSLNRHPWSLGGGGAAELKEMIEDACPRRLADHVQDIGFASFTGLDDAFIVPAHLTATLHFEREIVRPLVTGECVRDWCISPQDIAVTPYQADTQNPLPFEHNAAWGRWLWRYRAVLSTVASFGGRTREEEGQRWWLWYRWQVERYLAPFRITYAEIATHNHFAIDDGGSAFKQTAPIITLPPGTSRERCLALLAYLNSSLVCFWMKQVFFQKSAVNARGDAREKPERISYQFSGNGLTKLPVPNLDERFSQLAELALRLANERIRHAPRQVLATSEGASIDELKRLLEIANGADTRCLEQLIALQEEIDWLTYVTVGLAPPSALVPPEAWPILRSRLVDLPSRREAGAPESMSEELRQVWQERRRLISESAALAQVEHPMFKRPWLGTQGQFHRGAWTFDEQTRQALQSLLSEGVEGLFRARDAHVVSARELMGQLEFSRTAASFLELLLGAGTAAAKATLVEIVEVEAMPFLAALRLSETGLQIREAWENTWSLQRQDDHGESVGKLVAPPKYDIKDYRDLNIYRLRGRLDSPKERFISYPGCESDQDGEPVYGWAGWNHLQQAQALAALYQKRKTEEAWTKDRLTPMLAGLLELLPWIQQWHNAPSDEYAGMRLGDFFQTFIDGECTTLALTREDLTTWRPDPRKRGKASTKAKAASPRPRPEADEPAREAPADSPDPPPAARSAAAQKAWETRRKRKQPTGVDE